MPAIRSFLVVLLLTITSQVTVTASSSPPNTNSTATPSCSKSDFQCSDGACITMAFKCDGVADCGNGDDEKDCDTTKIVIVDDEVVYKPICSQDSVQINCKISAAKEKEINVTWHYQTPLDVDDKGRTLLSDGKIFINGPVTVKQDSNAANIILKNVTPSHSGLYSCAAKSLKGEKIHQYLLTFNNDRPQIQAELRNHKVHKGEKARFECSSKGCKPMEFAWFKNNDFVDEQILNSKGDIKYNISKYSAGEQLISVLIIDYADRYDSDLYSCLAENRYGNDRKPIVNLFVQGEPNVPYGLKMVNISERHVELSWITSDDENPTITIYVIEHKIGNNTWERELVSSTKIGNWTSASVFNLKPLTTYDFRIMAGNEYGYSGPSDVLTVTTGEEVNEIQRINAFIVIIAVSICTIMFIVTIVTYKKLRSKRRSYATRLMTEKNAVIYKDDNRWT